MSLVNRPDEFSPRRNAAELLPAVYEELRRVAAHRLAQEPAGQTLQGTALVHEAWLRIGGGEGTQFENRAHFFGAAAEAMRRILIDRARRKRALRHGGARERVDVAEIDIASPAPDDELLAVSEVLDRLTAEQPLKGELVKLRYFVGLTIEETAQVLGISEATAKRHWTYARAWLYEEIRQSCAAPMIPRGSDYGRA